MPRTLKDINIEVGARIKEERGRSGLSSESIRALSMALKVSADTLLFGEAPEEFAHIAQRLKSVPPQKRKHILRIIEEAIACSQ